MTTTKIESGSSSSSSSSKHTSKRSSVIVQQKIKNDNNNNKKNCVKNNQKKKLKSTICINFVCKSEPDDDDHHHSIISLQQFNTSNNTIKNIKSEIHDDFSNESSLFNDQSIIVESINHIDNNQIINYQNKSSSPKNTTKPIRIKRNRFNSLNNEQKIEEITKIKIEPNEIESIANQSESSDAIIKNDEISINNNNNSSDNCNNQIDSSNNTINKRRRLKRPIWKNHKKQIIEESKIQIKNEKQDEEEEEEEIIDSIPNENDDQNDKDDDNTDDNSNTKDDDNDDNHSSISMNICQSPVTGSESDINYYDYYINNYYYDYQNYLENQSIEMNNNDDNNNNKLMNIKIESLSNDDDDIVINNNNDNNNNNTDDNINNFINDDDNLTIPSTTATAEPTTTPTTTSPLAMPISSNNIESTNTCMSSSPTSSSTATTSTTIQSTSTTSQRTPPSTYDPNAFGVLRDQPEQCDAVKEQDDEPNKIFVGGLPWDTTEYDLEYYFSHFGKVIEINIKYDPMSCLTRGFCFITFQSEETVRNILRKPVHIIKGKIIELKRAKFRPICKKIFVGGVDSDLIAEDEIRDHFSQYGTVIAVETPRDKMRNRKRDFCFVIFESETDADRACFYPRQFIVNRICDVRKAQPQPICYQQKRIAATAGLDTAHLAKILLSDNGRMAAAAAAVAAYNSNTSIDNCNGNAPINDPMLNQVLTTPPPPPAIPPPPPPGHMGAILYYQPLPPPHTPAPNYNNNRSMPSSSIRSQLPTESPTTAFPLIPYPAAAAEITYSPHHAIYNYYQQSQPNHPAINSFNPLADCYLNYYAAHTAAYYNQQSQQQSNNEFRSMITMNTSSSSSLTSTSSNRSLRSLESTTSSLSSSNDLNITPSSISSSTSSSSIIEKPSYLYMNDTNLKNNHNLNLNNSNNLISCSSTRISPSLQSLYYHPQQQHHH